jgi:hypothetical protein
VGADDEDEVEEEEELKVPKVRRAVIGEIRVWGGLVKKPFGRDERIKEDSLRSCARG